MSWSSLSEGQQAATRLRQIFQQRIDQIEALNRKMDDAWQGDAADTANAGAHPLKAWLEDSHTKLQDSDRYLFDVARSKVQPISAQPPKSNFLNDITPADRHRPVDQGLQHESPGQRRRVQRVLPGQRRQLAGLPAYLALNGEIGDVGVDDGGPGGPNEPGRPGDGGGGAAPAAVMMAVSPRVVREAAAVPGSHRGAFPVVAVSRRVAGPGAASRALAVPRSARRAACGRWLTEEVPGSGEPLIALDPGTPQLLAQRLRAAQSRLPIS